MNSETDKGALLSWKQQRISDNIINCKIDNCQKQKLDDFFVNITIENHPFCVIINYVGKGEVF